MCASNNRAVKQVKEKMVKIKGERNKSTIIVGDFNALLSTIERRTRQKISRYTKALNTTTRAHGLDDSREYTGINSPQIGTWVQCIPIKIPVRFLVDTDEIILNIYGKTKE